MASEQINLTSSDLQRLHEQDVAHFIHPFVDFNKFHKNGSDFITQSQGCYVDDISGNRYVDGIGGLWCVNIGHGRKEIGAAMQRQSDQMAYYSAFNNMSNIPATELAAKLAELAPGNLNHVFYSCGGSTANDTSIRLAHFYFHQRGLPAKKKIISRHAGYHGTTYLAASMTGTEGINNGFNPIDGLVTHISAANCYRRPDNMDEEAYCDFLIDEFKQTLERLGAENVAAFIAEPIMGAGVLVAPKGYHRRMLDVCHENDVLYISDEVVTGFGRLGHFFASAEMFDIQPDIINIAKGLTSGYAPLGATLISSEMYDVIRQSNNGVSLLSTGYTYSGHPVSCAAALENIRIIEDENICEHVRNTGPYLKQSLQEKLSHHEIIGDIRGSHFMIGIESVANQESKEIFPVEAKVGYRIADECQKRGLIVRPIGHLNVISPPLIWTKDMIEHVTDILDQAFSAVTDSLHRDGLF